MSDQRGFTIIDMLVSLTIFAVVTGFLMANFRSGRTADELRIGAQNIGSAFREAQTMAMTGRTVAVCRGGSSNLKVCTLGVATTCPSGTCANEVPRGYGLKLSVATGEASQTVIYADINGNRAFDAGETLKSSALSTTSRVSVKALTPVSAGLLEVVFEPPKPTVFFNGGTATTLATVQVQHATSGATRNVTINRVSGQVSLD
jgi:Tfp pilus assembly protein FimT